MKKVLLGTSALLGAGLVASPAFAADGIKLELGGFFKTAVMGNWDDHGSSDLGNRRYNSVVSSDAEVWFKGKTTLDNGLTVGTRVELEGEQNNDQIDAAFVFFQGGFGEVRIGSQNGAMAAQCITPVGSTANFGAISPSSIGNNAMVDTNAGSATVCESVDSEGSGSKSQKIVYITPSFGGFQLALSWSPNGAHESAGVSNGHAGMPAVVDGEQRNVVDAYASFSHDFDGWSLSAGGGGSWALSTGGTGGKKQQDYQAGLNLTFGSFSVGGAFEYMNNENRTGVSLGADQWTGAAGMAYNVDAWTVGLQYSYTKVYDTDALHTHRNVHQIELTGKYDMGPGIALDAGIGYAHANGSSGDAAHGGYDAFNVGLGTSFTF
ncbi:MAG TPA: porin [Dongiaceae bacterium]